MEILKSTWFNLKISLTSNKWLVNRVNKSLTEKRVTCLPHLANKCQFQSQIRYFSESYPERLSGGVMNISSSTSSSSCDVSDWRTLKLVTSLWAAAYRRSSIGISCKTLFISYLPITSTLQRRTEIFCCGKYFSKKVDFS